MIRIGNILNKALGSIGSRKVIWKRFDKRTQNDRGEFVNQYHTNKVIYGSFQPVSARQKAQMGVKVSDVYNKLFVSQNVLGIDRLKSPDIIIVDGIDYEVIDVQDWYGQNGWKEVLCSRKI